MTHDTVSRRIIILFAYYYARVVLDTRESTIHTEYTEWAL